MDETEAHGWEHVTHRRGITVHRKFMPALNGVMSKFCCVRASGVLEASCLEVAELFEGNTRVAEYNKYFAEGRDLEHVRTGTPSLPPSRPLSLPLSLPPSLPPSFPFFFFSLEKRFW